MFDVGLPRARPSTSRVTAYQESFCVASPRSDLSEINCSCCFPTILGFVGQTWKRECLVSGYRRAASVRRLQTAGSAWFPRNFNDGGVKWSGG